MLTKRASLSAAERKEKSAKILAEVRSAPFYQVSRTILIYLSFREEVETGELAEAILSEGRVLLAPWCAGERLHAARVHSLSADTAPGMWGIPEPLPALRLPVPPQDIDLILVPGAAFDRKGQRLGYGKGYYDRYLPALRRDAVVCGLAFAAQLLEEIPAEAHDRAMDFLITEEGVAGPGVINYKSGANNMSSSTSFK
jgi:5-formyltetrahydrofolate cyclo-ligase